MRRSHARLVLARRLLAVDGQVGKKIGRPESVNVTASLPQLRLYDRRRVRPLADLPLMYESFSRILLEYDTLVG